MKLNIAGSCFILTLACQSPLDVMFLQPSTEGFHVGIQNIVDQLPEIVAYTQHMNPGSRFGVAEYKDKPFYPLGDEHHFCYRLQSGLTDDITRFKEGYERIHAISGGDVAASQFQALIDVAYANAVSWNNTVKGIILVTDSVPHVAGDLRKACQVYPSVPCDLVDNEGTSSDERSYDICIHQDYPSAEQVQAALKTKGIALGIVVSGSDDTVVKSWSWVNNVLLEQPAAFVQTMATDSSDTIHAVLSIITAMRDNAKCSENPSGSVPESRKAERNPLPGTQMDVTAGSAECLNPCPAPPHACCRRPELIINVNNNPEKLLINYVK